METYKQVNDYLLFKELFSDSLGKTYRGGELAGKRAMAHKIVTLVHPFYLRDERTWNRINILLEGIKKSNIPHLYSPEKILKDEEQALLVFPMLKAKTFEQVIEDAEKKDNPINFDLAFSIALQIAELIDIGSSIVVSGKKSFHGFLTADNILIDHDGNIMLKNYGITPYIDSSDELFTELEKKYGAWLTPEFLRREKIVPQSDIYHLGYLLYRMLTGKYFFYTEGEDFEAKFANLSFSQHIPSTDKDFLTNIIGFFKRTLNPDPAQRFGSIKELKDYVSNTFHIEELSSVTFNLAYFMNSLYSDEVEKEDQEMVRELDYVIPEEKEEIAEAPVEEAKQDDKIVESILTGLDEKEKSRSRFMIPMIIGAVVLVVASIAIFLIISQNKKAEQIRLEALREQQRLEERLLQTQQEFQNRLKTLQEQSTTTEAEQLQKEEQIRELEEWKQEQERKLRAQMQAEEEAKKQAEAEKQRKAEEERQRKAEEERKRKELEAKKEQQAIAQKKREEEMKQIKEGDIVALNMVTQKPQKLEGREPRFNSAIRRKYKDQQMTVIVSMLIDETGKVSKVKVLGNVPADIKLAIVGDLADWIYTPAKKDDIKVKVWLQVPIKIEF